MTRCCTFLNRKVFGALLIVTADNLNPQLNLGLRQVATHHGRWNLILLRVVCIFTRFDSHFKLEEFKAIACMRLIKTRNFRIKGESFGGVRPELSQPWLPRIFASLLIFFVPLSAKGNHIESSLWPAKRNLTTTAITTETSATQGARLSRHGPDRKTSLLKGFFVPLS